MDRKVIAAAIQYEPAMFATPVNLEELYRLTEEAAQKGANLIVLPELATTGHCWSNRWELAPYVETIPGPTTELFLNITKRYGCYLVIGLAETDSDTGVFYNSAALLGPDGVVGRYRKTHLSVSDPRWAAVGNLGLPVFDTELGRIGIALSMDLEFPEPARVLALKGAEIIAFPCNWMGETCPSGLWMTRALENEVYLVAANRWGQERGIKYSGGSCVIDPRGKVLTYQGSGNGIIGADIYLNQSRGGTEDYNDRESVYRSGADLFSVPERIASWPKGFLGKRRPELYQQLMCFGHLWRPEQFFGLDRYNPLPPGRESTIGVVQFEPVPGSRENNLQRIKHWVEQAKRKQPELQLLVFPELATTGFIPNQMAELAEPIPGTATSMLRPLAMEHALYLVWGMAERAADGRFYQTAVMLGPDGRMHTYRKVHLLAEDEAWAKPGAALPLPIDTPLGRIGLLLSTDLLFPEAARCLATQGVDLLVVPSALGGSGLVGLEAGRNLEVCSPQNTDPFHWCIWRIRAWENSVFLAVANQASRGETRRDLNVSGVFGPVPYTRCEPCREIIANPAEGIMITAVSTSRGTPAGYEVRIKDNLRRRNTGLYQELIRSRRPHP